jgi:hypothetical protein
MIMAMSRSAVACLCILVVTATACTGAAGDQADPQPGAHSSSDASTSPDEAGADTLPTTVHSIVERVAPENLRLVDGPDDLTYHLTAAGSNGDTAVVAGQVFQDPEAADDALADFEPTLMYSVDGHEWELVDLPDSVPDTFGARAIAAVGEELLVVGNLVASHETLVLNVLEREQAGQPVVLPFKNGAIEEPRTIDFADEFPGTHQVLDATATGDQLVVLGAVVDAAIRQDPVEGSALAFTLAVSGDHGRTWESSTLPDVLAPVNVPPEVAISDLDLGILRATTILAADDQNVYAAIEPYYEGGMTLWRLEMHDDTWSEIGPAHDLFDGDELQGLHQHGDTLLAFTSNQSMINVWRSDASGATFERLDLDAAVFGGSGRQVFKSATTLPDGTLAVAGETHVDPFSFLAPAKPEIWISQDLDKWHRGQKSPAFGGSGSFGMTGLARLDNELVLVGSHTRERTEEEREEALQVYTPLPQNIAAWTVQITQRPVVDSAIRVERSDATGLEGNARINDLIEYEGGLVGGGWVSEDDTRIAAIWTSADGIEWERLDAPDLNEPEDQFIRALTEHEGGLVAVGNTQNGDDSHVTVWTSPDGAEWERSELAESEEFAAEAQDVITTDHGLIMVGGRDANAHEDRLHIPGIWMSDDNGVSWTEIDSSQTPFWGDTAEQLFAVTARPDGTVLAGGYSGEADLSRRAYRPGSFTVQASDSLDWTGIDFPGDEDDFGIVYSMDTHNDDVFALGVFLRNAEDLPGASAGDFVSTSGIAKLDGDRWTILGENYSRNARPVGSASAPFGFVVAGHWGRQEGQPDLMIGVVTDDELTFLSDGIDTGGASHAYATAPLGDSVVVVGGETIPGDEPDENELVYMTWTISADED